MMVKVVLQVSAPDSRSVLTFALKILTLILADSYFESHMFSSCRDAALDMSILVFTSAPDPACLSTTLPRYVKMCTFSRASLSIVIALVLCVAFQDLAFPFIYVGLLPH